MKTVRVKYQPKEPPKPTNATRYAAEHTQFKAEYKRLRKTGKLIHIMYEHNTVKR